MERGPLRRPSMLSGHEISIPILKSRLAPDRGGVRRRQRQAESHHYHAPIGMPDLRSQLAIRAAPTCARNSNQHEPQFFGDAVLGLG